MENWKAKKFTNTKRFRYGLDALSILLKLIISDRQKLWDSERNEVKRRISYQILILAG
jgi:hypothetical protein